MKKGDAFVSWTEHLYLGLIIFIKRKQKTKIENIEIFTI